MGSVKHRCGQSPDGPDPVNPRPGPAPADRGADEGQSRFCSQCEVLTARLAEVEAERDTAAERWINTAKALADAQTERDGLLMQNDLGGERLWEMAAERDRLVQELEKALGHLRAVMNAERQAPPHRPQEDDEALAFLARFPREGDEG